LLTFEGRNFVFYGFLNHSQAGMLSAICGQPTWLGPIWEGLQPAKESYALTCLEEKKAKISPRSQQGLRFVKPHTLFKSWISDSQLTLVGVSEEMSPHHLIVGPVLSVCVQFGISRTNI